MYHIINPILDAKIISPVSSKIKIEISVNEYSQEAILDLEGDRASIVYPSHWILYHQQMEVDGDLETYEALIEEAEQFVDGLEVYISKSTDSELLKKIRLELKKILSQEPCPVVSTERERILGKFIS